MAKQLESGKAAEKDSGFPDIFIEAGKKASTLSAAILSFRVNQAPNVGKGFAVSPKPLSIKTKTCKNTQGIPLLNGFIAVDGKTFGRKNSDAMENITDHLKNKLIKNQQAEEANKFSNQPLKIKWQELNEDIKKKIYSIVNTENINIENNYYIFKSNKINNHEFATDINREQLNFRVKIKENIQPNELVSIEYRINNKSQFKNLEIICYENYPITSDADIFAVLPSLKKMQELEKITAGKLHKPYDTNKTQELAELAVQYLLIKHTLDQQPINVDCLDSEEFEAIQNNSALKNAGILSPYELFIMLTINKMVSASFDQTLAGAGKLIRHGGESFNPDQPSDLNSNVLHIWDNATYLTDNEITLRDFYLNSGALTTHFLPIHPAWNFNIWGPIITEQLKLGQENLIPKNILENYYKNIKENNNKKKSILNKSTLALSSSTAALIRGLKKEDQK